MRIPDTEHKPPQWAYNMFKHQPWEVMPYIIQYCAAALNGMPPEKQEEFYVHFRTGIEDEMTKRLETANTTTHNSQ